MKRTHPDLPWCRYADDGLVHCRTEQEAEALRAELQARLEECRLEMHPTKTKIVYCKDGKRKGTYPNVTFLPWIPVSTADGQKLSKWATILQLHSRCQPLFAEGHPIDGPGLEHPAAHRAVVGRHCSYANPLLRGWIQYYGRYNPSALEIMLRYLNLTVLRWVMRKFKRFQGRKVGAANFLEKLVRIQPSLFEHWRIRMIGAFA